MWWRSSMPMVSIMNVAQKLRWKMRLGIVVIISAAPVNQR